MPARPLRSAALASLLGGVALLLYAVATGEARVGIFLIVPYLVGTGAASALGMLLLLVAAVAWALSAPRAAPPVERAPQDEAPGGRARTRSGGVVLLGPIPIVWGSDRRILPWMVAAGAALLLLALLLTRR